MTKNRTLPLLIMLFLAIVIVALPGIPKVSAQQSLNQFPIGQEVINVTVDPSYSIFDINSYSPISASLQYAFLPQNNNTVTLTLLSEFNPQIVTATAVLWNGTVRQVPISVAPGEFSAFYGYSGFLPPLTENLSISIQAYQPGESILFRYVMDVPFLIVSGPPVTPSTQVNIVTTDHNVISQAYGQGSASAAGADLSVPAISEDGSDPGVVVYPVEGTGIADVVVQSSYYVPVAITLTILAAILLVLASLGLFERGRAVTGRIWMVMKTRFLGIVKSLFSMFHLGMSSNNRRPFPFSIRWIRSRLQPKTLLVIFIMCAFSMISLAALTGPGPTARVYAVANPGELSGIQHSFENCIGNLQLQNPSQDYIDFNVMSSVGEFRMVVISEYSQPTLPALIGDVLPELNNVPVIVIDSSANPQFVQEIQTLYPDNVINVTSATDLSQSECSLIQGAYGRSVTQNFFGVHISESGYTHVLEIEAALSFLLIFFGWMYLGAKIAEPGVETTLTRIGAVILSGVFIFVFSEEVYVATSATLAFPLSLHAILSGAQSITATGLLGRVTHLPFGGGSTPRLLSGFLGMVIGALLIGGQKVFSMRTLVFVVGFFGILLANPFAVGKLMFQAVLLFVGNISLGEGFSSALTLKGFYYGLGSVLGGTTTPVYLMSAGKMAYFSSLVPLAFLRKMGKNTATITMLVAAILAGDGGVRVGEMTPDKTVIAVLPGLVAGMAIALIFLLMSGVEKYMTSTYSKSRP